MEKMKYSLEDDCKFRKYDGQSKKYYCELPDSTGCAYKSGDTILIQEGTKKKYEIEIKHVCKKQ